MHCRQLLQAAALFKSRADLLIAAVQGEQMAAAAAAASPAVLVIGYTMHFSPVLRRMRELVQGGELGTVVHCHW